MTNLEIKNLSDDALRAQLKELAARERRITREMIEHLAEFAERRLYRAEGVSNLWQYCTKVLGLSEDQAKLRIVAAQAIRNHAELRSALERGELSPSAIRRLAPAMGGRGDAALVAKAAGRSLREVERLAAGVIVAKEVEAARAAGAQAQVTAPTLFEDGEGGKLDVPIIAAELVRSRNPDSVRPVSDEDWLLHFVASSALIEDLETARNLLARRYPAARLEDVVGAALKFLLERIDPGRRAARRAERKASLRNREAGASTRRPAIPQALRDAVLERDGHQCAFIEPDGRRCPERRYLEIDHIQPAALGGSTVLENLRALCRGHNAVAADLAFGAAFIALAIERRRAEKRGLTAPPQERVQGP